VFAHPWSFLRELAAPLDENLRQTSMGSNPPPPVPPPNSAERGASVDDAGRADASAPVGTPPLPRDRVAGFSIIFVAFAAALVISWKASEAVKPNVAPEPAPPSSEGLSGYPSQVDPVLTLSLAQSLTGRGQLRRIVATGVASNGTVDLQHASSAIRYEFDSAQGEGPEPPRPAGTVRAVHYCGRQTVNVKRDGIYADPDQPRAPCRVNTGAPLPEPRCSLDRLWAEALRRGAPASGYASVEYFRANEGPAWRFSLPEAKVNFTLFGDCERELKGKDARPIAP
jgi:hypothetical protein